MTISSTNASVQFERSSEIEVRYLNCCYNFHLHLLVRKLEMLVWAVYNRGLLMLGTFGEQFEMFVWIVILPISLYLFHCPKYPKNSNQWVTADSADLLYNHVTWVVLDFSSRKNKTICTFYGIRRSWPETWWLKYGIWLRPLHLLNLLHF